MNVRILQSSCCVILLVLSSGCKSPEEDAFTAGSDSTLENVNTLSTGGVTAFGAGDVEFDMRVLASIAEKSEASNVRVTQSESINDRITRVQADWYPPYPEEAWVTVVVYSRTDYPVHAVLLSTQIFVDGKEVETHEFVGGPSLRTPKEYVFDVLKYVDGKPDTILIYAETELTLYLETDVTTIDPESPPEAPATAKATLLSNSLRINFHP